jgi:hypothetical protein
MVSGVVLLAGLGAVMMIGSQIAYTPSTSTHSLAASRVVSDLADELRFATFIAEHTSTALEFAVADRDGDHVAERIRYEWSGTPGDPLLRTYNGGTPATIAQGVQSFQCSLTLDTRTTTIATTTDTAEAVLVANNNSPTGVFRNISAMQFSAQRISASAIAAGAAVGAESWNATRVEFMGRQSVLPNETLRVQIRSSGSPNDSPTSQLLGEVAIPEASISSGVAWNTATFVSPIRGLALHRSYALVWRGTTGDAQSACQLSTDDVGTATGVTESDDAGASWQYMPSRRTFFRVYGTYTSPGPTYNVTRNFATRATISLQAGDTAASRIDASVPLDNEPELLSAYWRTDLDSDPTTLDVNGDGVADWQAATVYAWDVADPQPYHPNTVTDGIWQVSGKLITQPINDFAGTTIIDVRFRNTPDAVPDGSSAVVWINADWTAGMHSPLAVRLKKESDSSQSLTLIGKPSDSSEVVLFGRQNLSASDFVRCRLTILPEENLVNVQLNNVDQGTFTYFAYSSSSTDRFISLFGDTGTTEFDYVDIRVLPAND